MSRLRCVAQISWLALASWGALGCAARVSEGAAGEGAAAAPAWSTVAGVPSASPPRQSAAQPPETPAAPSATPSAAPSAAPSAPHLPPPTSPAEPEAPATGQSFREPLGSLKLDPTAPAMRFANLSPSACRKELARRELAVTVDKRGYRHVALPVRISGLLHGVRLRTAPASSKHGVLDCRLALALDAVAEVLAEHDVVEVHIGTMYRPGARIRGRGKRSQHAYALAADITALVKTDGQIVPVKGSWGGDVGDTPCGPDSTVKRVGDDVLFMRNAICALARRGVLHHILTPSADAAHRGHLHFDIQRDARLRWIR